MTLNLRRLVALSCFALLAATTARAAEPQLSVIDPVGVQIGVETEVKFIGARLADAQGLLLYSPGVTVTSLTAPADNTVVAKLKVEPNAPLGMHGVRVRTATGISNLMTFSVGRFPVVVEVEPNSDFDKPQAIALDTTVHGIVQNEDVDYFVVDAKKGERISAELEGLRLGYTTFDPYLAILNAKRFELARSDDAALLMQDSVCAIVAPEDGKYIVQVRESAYGGDGNCRYRLHVGRFPRPTAAYPAGGKPGESIDVKWLGAPSGEFVQKVVLPPAGPKGSAQVIAQDGGGLAASPNTVRVVDLPNVMEVEPNNALAEATPAAAIPAAFNGIIATPGDVDHFKFHAKPGVAYDIRVHARNPLRSPLDSVLTVLNSKGGGVGSNDDSNGPDSYLRFQAPAEDDYIVVVTDHLQAGGADFVYRVEITPVAPALTMILPERQQYIPTTLTIPRGGRMALMVGAQRANWGGPLAVEFPGMPQGVTVQAVPMTANRSEIPVLFSAAADAPVGGALVELVGKATEPTMNGLAGQFYQRAMLVRGQNNRDVWGHDADRMAVAVASESPFSIEVVQPKVPIVRNGTMQLKVVAKRAMGYAQPIAISVLYNPPGISAQGGVSIPADKDEAIINVTANGGAEINKWPMAVIGRGAAAGASVENASQMFELEVADTYFDFAFEKSAAEQGKDTEVVVRVTKKKDFEGQATAELVGLPPGATATNITFAKDTAELVFPVKTAADAREGRHTTLLVKATVTANGEPILHTLGTGELRIDKPLPPKVAAPAPMPMPMPQPMPQPMVAEAPKPPPMKRLSRLEQLRLEREMNKGGK